MNEEAIIPVAHVDHSSIEDIEASIQALAAAILVLDDDIAECFCDGGELQRERSAYDEDGYADALRHLDARMHVLHAEMAVKAYTLAYSVRYLATYTGLHAS